MCGIFGYVGKKTTAPKVVLDGLKALEYRGYDSWGVAAVPVETGPKPSIVVKKKIGKIGEGHVDELPPSNFAFGHTRWATHGGVTDANAHPHLDCTHTIAIIHNGIVENYEGIKKRLVKKGHMFVSDTDSEVIAHLVEDYCKTMIFTKAVQKAFNELAGLNAVIVMKADEHKFVAARNGSPLVVGFNATENYVASDASALLPHTRQVHFLEDEQMAIISEKAVMLFNVKTGERMMPKKQHLNWSVAQVEKGKYPYYMLKEINEQPSLIADIAASNLSQAQNLAKYINQSDEAYIVACGSSSYAGIAGTYLFSKIAKRHMNWAIGSEFSYQLDFLTPKSLVIALSQSGETMDILEGVKRAKDKKAKIFAIVNVLGSTLYRLADYKMLIGAGPEKAVASTKALTGKLSHLVLLAYAIAGRPEEGQRHLMEAAKASKAVLSKGSVQNIQALANKIYKASHIYVIGRGLSYPAALETAIKIKEIAYIHAEGMAAGELKHGPLALVEKGTPCIAFLPNDETYGANLAGAMEMKARGGYIIGISHKPHELFDVYIPVKDAAEATIIPNIIVGQLLAYHLTMKRGFDPDKPRNLAKSVTVK